MSSEMVTISRASLAAIYAAIQHGDEEGLAVHAPPMMEAAKVLSPNEAGSAEREAARRILGVVGLASPGFAFCAVGRLLPVPLNQCMRADANCPVASGELVGDGSCESCADEPATTGARAEVVEESYERRIARIGCRCTRPDARACAGEKSAFSERFPCPCDCHRTAPPEVTHGAAIGGDIVRNVDGGDVGRDAT